jgi:hypothetical protein
MTVKLLAEAILAGAVTLATTIPAHAIGSGRQQTPEEEAAEQLKKATEKHNDGVEKVEKSRW